MNKEYAGTNFLKIALIVLFLWVFPQREHCANRTVKSAVKKALQ